MCSRRRRVSRWIGATLSAVLLAVSAAGGAAAAPRDALAVFRQTVAQFRQSAAQLHPRKRHVAKPVSAYAATARSGPRRKGDGGLPPSPRSPQIADTTEPEPGQPPRIKPDDEMAAGAVSEPVPGPRL